MIKVEPQKILDGSALLAGVVEGITLGDLPPIVNLIAWGLITASIISHIIRMDKGAPRLNIGGDKPSDGPGDI